MVNQSQPTVLLTRPMAQSQRFAAGLMGNVVLSPLMEPQFLSPNLPETVASAVIFTSETGVEAASLLDLPLPKRAYCVGKQTALAAQEKGWQVISGDGDAKALAALILQKHEQGPILFLRAEKVARDLEKDLNSAGIETFSAVVYRQLPLSLSATAVAVLQSDHPVFLPLFSPQSARLFEKEYLRIGAIAPLCVVAISDAVIAALNLLTHDIEIAAHPDATAMRRALADLTRRVVLP